MVLDLNLFRKDKGGDPEAVRESLRRRFKPVEVVDEVIRLDEKWKELRFQLDNLNRDRTATSKEIGKKIRSNPEEANVLKEKVKAMKDQITATKADMDATWELLQNTLNAIGNLVDDSVPVSHDEEDNEIITKWGEFTKNEESNLPHYELLEKVNAFDHMRGVKVAGARGYFLTGIGVRLNLALINFGLNFLMERGYTPIQTPFFMNKDLMAKTAQLAQFDEELYKVVGDGTDKYLIATSEQPISAFHANEWLEEKSLPIRYGGQSTCFRKEAGSSGRDIRGIFRVHQFEKIEQFCLTTPETSWEEHERMLKVSEEFYQALQLPYRVVTIVSGELNDAAAKKYDLEGWFPSFETFRELVSCSNCTDYQSRSLEIRCGSLQQDQKKDGKKEKKYVHMLNSTLCATGRTMCCIVENYQTKDGIKIPEVLQPYLGGIDFVPFEQQQEE